MVRVQKKPGFLKKKPNPLGFIGFWGFLDKQEKIGTGKIIQKLSNLKP